MTINQAPLLQKLIVRSFAITDDRDLSDLESRLMHMGFINGETIQVKRKAILFKEPLLVEVRGRLIALSREEAQLVEVEVSA
jgi:Fe2+ transport system protein FeoA